jgi:hypothetical protein
MKGNYTYTRNLLLGLLLLLPGLVFSQNLTGTWIGDEGRGTFLKLVIVHIGDSCYGYTYDEGGGGYCRADFAGRVNGRKKQLAGTGMKLLEATRDHELANYKLTYHKIDGEDYLIGPVTGQSFFQNLLGNIATLATATLKRESEVIDSTKYILATLRRLQPILERPPVTLPKNTDVAVVEQPVPEVVKPVTPPPVPEPIKPKPVPPPDIVTQKKERETKTIQTFTVNVDTLRMTVYDNGVMDNDTVSIFLDNVILLKESLITVKGQTIDIPLPKDGKDHQIILFAHNLGSIPPNTAYIVFYAGEKRYELRAAFDLKVNAAILVRRE